MIRAGIEKGLRRPGVVGRALSLILATAVMVTALGCGGSAPAGKPVVQPSETQELRRRLVDMEQRAIMGEVESKRLRAEVERLEKELAEVKEQAKRTAPTAGPSAPIGDGIGGIDLAPRIESAELEEPAPGPALGDPVGSGAGGSPGTDVPGVPANRYGESAQEIYDQGYALFHNRQYQQAELAFGQVLEHHRDHELADNALFWIGESRYARGDYANALTAFTATVERYPGGNKVGDAMLKAGKCLEALGQVERAVQTYEELQSLFPDTAAAIVAEERLGRLR